MVITKDTKHGMSNTVTICYRGDTWSEILRKEKRAVIKLTVVRTLPQNPDTAKEKDSKR